MWIPGVYSKKYYVAIQNVIYKVPHDAEEGLY